MNRKHRLVALGAAAAVLAFAAVALAAGPPGPGAGMGGHMGQGSGHMGQGMGAGMMAGPAMMKAAAEYLGVTQTELYRLHHDGKSLAEIAKDKGRSVAGLQDALVKAFKANLDKSVAAGRISEAQAAKALASFKAHVETMVTHTGMGAGMGMGTGAGHCGG